MARKNLLGRAPPFFLLLLLICHASSAIADTAEASDSPSSTLIFKLPKEEKQEIKRKVKQAQGQDLDKEITDIGLRAISGSKSQWSSSYFFHYYGSAINSMGDSTRPLIAGNRLQQPTDLDGNVGLRYRFSEHNSLFMAVGMYKSDPVHTNEAQQPMTFNNPELDFNTTRKINGVQLSSNTVAMVSTVPYQLQANQIGSLMENVALIKPIGFSRFDVGTWLSLWYVVFGNQTVTDKVATTQNDVSVQVSPSIDYRPTKNTKIWTSVSVLNVRHYRSDPAITAFASQDDGQLFGVAFAPMRDIYINPFVQFEPLQMALNRTIFNLSTDINF